jgi:hypothetical protein
MSIIPSNQITESYVYQQMRKDQADGKEVWLVFGLSANPIHAGHIDYLDKFAKNLSPDRVILIPTKVNPQKKLEDQCSAQQKKEMILLAIQGRQGWELDEQELIREGASYTWDTIEQLKNNAGTHAKIYFLLSNESAANLHTWNPPPRIYRDESDLDQLEYCRNFIAENATIVFGERSGIKFDPSSFYGRLEVIDQVARNALNSPFKDTIDVKLNDGQKMIIEAQHVQAIGSRLFQALREGYVPIQSDKEISSTEIRNICKNKDLTAEERIARLIPLVDNRELAEYMVTNNLFSA